MISKRRTKQALGAVLLAVTLALLLFGIGGLTWMKPSSTAKFISPDSPSQVVVTGENVLESTGESVTFLAKGSPDQEIFLGVGLTSDVKAFAAPIDHLLLKNFAPGGSFEVKQVPAKKDSAYSEQPGGGLQGGARPAQSDAGDLTTLDIWKQTATGKGSASLKWNLSDSRWSAVVFVKSGPGADAVKVPSPEASKPAAPAAPVEGSAKEAPAGSATPTATSPASKGKTPGGKAEPNGPKLQMQWHHEPSLALPWALTITGAIALAAILVYLFLSWFSEVRSRARRQDAVEKDKTRRLAAEVTGEIEATAHPRRAARMAQAQGKKSRTSKTERGSAKAEEAAGESATSSEAEGALLKTAPAPTAAATADSEPDENADSQAGAAEAAGGKRSSAKPPKPVRTYFWKSKAAAEDPWAGGESSKPEPDAEGSKPGLTAENATLGDAGAAAGKEGVIEKDSAAVGKENATSETGSAASSRGFVSNAYTRVRHGSDTRSQDSEAN